MSPIVATEHAWTFVPIADAVCDDGTQTGIGVNPGDATKLLIFFEGGGACGDYSTCYELNTATHGPFGAAELSAGPREAAKILDRTDSNNPFAAYTMVYVPYCTGDLHAGIRVATYTKGTDTKTYHHNGHINALRALDRLSVTWPGVTTLAVTGASAGGYGALLNYHDTRNRWPSAASLLLDDSGPTLESSVTSPFLKAWFPEWGVFDWAASFCAGCADDPGMIPSTLAALHPSDRMALLSSLQDKTISTYYLLQPADFQAALLKLASDHIDPLAHFRRYFIAGDSHTMLGNPAGTSVNNVTLWAWLNAMVTGSASWTNQAP